MRDETMRNPHLNARKTTHTVVRMVLLALCLVACLAPFASKSASSTLAAPAGECTPICFRSAKYWNLAFKQPSLFIPKGTIDLDFQDSVPSTNKRVGTALKGGSNARQQLRQEFVALQLTVLDTILNDIIGSRTLACQGVNISPVSLANGDVITSDTTIDGLLAKTMNVLRNGSEGDLLTMAGVLHLLNGDSIYGCADRASAAKAGNAAEAEEDEDDAVLAPKRHSLDALDLGNQSVLPCASTCFRSPVYWARNLITLAKVPGINGSLIYIECGQTVPVILSQNNPNTGTGNRIAAALNNVSGSYNRLRANFVATQLTLLGSAADDSILFSPLSCQGVTITRTLTNGDVIAPNVTMFELFQKIKLVFSANYQNQTDAAQYEADVKALGDILVQINGTSPTGCNQKPFGN